MALPFCPVFARDMVQRLYTPYFFSEGQNSFTDELTEVKPGLDRSDCSDLRVMSDAFSFSFPFPFHHFLFDLLTSLLKVEVYPLSSMPPIARSGILPSIIASCLTFLDFVASSDFACLNSSKIRFLSSKTTCLSSSILAAFREGRSDSAGEERSSLKSVVVRPSTSRIAPSAPYRTADIPLPKGLVTRDTPCEC